MANLSMSKAKPPPGRRERRKQEIVERILEAGRQLYLEQDYESTTIDQICARAQISRMTFYKYFPSKQHLIWAQCDDLFFRQIDQLVADAREHSRNTITQMRLFLENTAERLRGYTASERALLREAIQGMAQSNDRGTRGWGYLRDRLEEMIEEGRSRDDISKNFSTRLLVAVINGTLSALTLSWTYNNNFPAYDYLYKLADFLSVVLRKQPPAVRQ
jgi:AcrR family transcriptional regulator